MPEAKGNDNSEHELRAHHLPGKLHELTHIILQNTLRWVPSIIMSILQMNKLRHRELSNLPKNTKSLSGGQGPESKQSQTRAPVLNLC